MPDLDGIEASVLVNGERQTPFILVSAHHDAETLTRIGADHVMGYLVKPVSEADLKTAIRMAMLRHAHFQSLLKENTDLKQTLEDRKLVERAKGILMKRQRIDEEEAFRQVRKYASNHNKKLVEVSKQVIDAEEVFALLEKV